MKAFRLTTAAVALLTASLFATTISAKGKNPGTDSIYDIADSIPEFSLLVDLVDAAGLADTLTFDGQFTVFAPTNDAFPFATVDEGVAFLGGVCETDDVGEIVGALTNILLHHVRDGRRFSGSLLNGKGPKSVEMLNGYIWVNDDTTIVTGSGGDSAINLDTYDVSASNGVIHAITQVMLPADLCVVPEE